MLKIFCSAQKCIAHLFLFSNTNKEDGIRMKKLGFSAAAILTGTLLFTGVNADAASYDSVNQDNAISIAQEVAAENGFGPETQDFFPARDEGDYYIIGTGNKSGSGSGAYRVYKDGKVTYRSGGVESNPYVDVGNYQFAENNAPADNTSTTAQADQAPAAQQSPQAEQNGQTQQAQQINAAGYPATDLHDDVKNEAQVLPETGESSNGLIAGLVGSIFAVAGLVVLRFKKSIFNK